MNPKRLTRREALKIGAGLVIGTSIKIAAADSTPAWANGVTY